MTAAAGTAASTTSAKSCSTTGKASRSRNMSTRRQAAIGGEVELAGYGRALEVVRLGRQADAPPRSSPPTCPPAQWSTRTFARMQEGLGRGRTTGSRTHDPCRPRRRSARPLDPAGEHQGTVETGGQTLRQSLDQEVVDARTRAQPGVLVPAARPPRSPRAPARPGAIEPEGRNTFPPRRCGPVSSRTDAFLRAVSSRPGSSMVRMKAWSRLRGLAMRTVRRRRHHPRAA